MEQQCLISVVIPTYERPDLLTRCLDRVLSSIAATGRNDIEVLVTDASYSDRTEQLIQSSYPQVRRVAGPHDGPARNRNFGASMARGRYLFFTDDDDYPVPGWVGAYLKAIADHPQIRVFEGRTLADRPMRRLDEEAPLNATGGYLWSCNMAIERELFLRMGGFCERFLGTAGNEDVDFRLRLVADGEPFWFVPEAEICHPYRPTKGLAFQLKVGRSYLLLASRHPYILGRRPILRVGANTLRLLKETLRLGIRCRFRGIGYALGRIGISQCFAIAAAVSRNSSAGLEPTRS